MVALKRPALPRIGRLLATCAICIGLAWGESLSANADFVFTLGPLRSTAGSKFFEVDLTARSTDGAEGQIELINLDIAGSRFNDAALSDFDIVQFSTASALDGYQINQFGERPGFESQILLDGFAIGVSDPVDISGAEIFAIGTFTVDLEPLGATLGDRFVLDIAGIDDGTSSRTTSIAFRSTDGLTQLVNPDFSGSAGGVASRTFVVSAVPEPGSFALLGTVAGLATLGRWRARQRSRDPRQS